MINTAKEISRARRAEFWGAILTGVAAGAEYALAENNEYYVPGGLFAVADAATAAISMAGQISNRLGMTYTKKQIKQADEITMEFLKFANMEPTALVSALSKIKNYYETEKAFADLNQGDLKDLKARVERLSEGVEIKEFGNRIYRKTMSGVTTFNAIIHQNTKNFAASERMAQKNIDNNLASVDDYVIIIKANMSRTNSPEANEQNLKLIEKVKGMTLVPNLNLNKQEILLLLRMDKQTKASNALKEYVGLLSEYQKQAGGSDYDWAASEINWANNLYQRVGPF